MHRGALPRPPRSAGRAGCYKLVTNYGTLKLTLGCVFLDLWDPRGGSKYRCYKLVTNYGTLKRHWGAFFWTFGTPGRISQIK